MSSTRYAEKLQQMLLDLLPRGSENSRKKVVYNFIKAAEKVCFAK